MRPRAASEMLTEPMGTETRTTPLLSASDNGEAVTLARHTFSASDTFCGPQSGICCLPIEVAISQITKSNVR